jgi:hypothetical protein
MAKIHDSITRYYKADRVPQTATRTLSLASLVVARDDWARLQIAENGDGSFDVVIRLDGSYGAREDAERVLASFAMDAARLAFGDAAVPAQIGADNGEIVREF